MKRALILLAVLIVLAGCAKQDAQLAKTIPDTQTAGGDTQVNIGVQEPAETGQSVPEAITDAAPVASEPVTSSTLEVIIYRTSFDPEVITINKGETVTWVSMDDRSHLIISKEGPEFKSQTLKQGDTFSYIFEEAGTVEYIDGIFGTSGTIIVK